MLDPKEKGVIKSVVADEIDKFIEKMNNKKPHKNNFITDKLNSTFVFYSSFSRSFDSTLGNTFEKIAIRLATYFYGDSKVYAPDSGADLVILKNSTCYVIELKLGGNLDSKKLPKEFSALREYYDKKNNELPWKKTEQKPNFNTLFDISNNSQIENLKEIKPLYCLATVYIEDEVKHKLENYKFRDNESLLLQEKFWNLVCNDKKDGFETILEAYNKKVPEINVLLDFNKKNKVSTQLKFN